MTMKSSVLERFLTQQGYTCSTRDDGFVTVLLARDDERWLGHGPDDASALHDAVHQMFPSAAARLLLARMLDAQAASDETAPAEVPTRVDDAWTGADEQAAASPLAAAEQPHEEGGEEGGEKGEEGQEGQAPEPPEATPPPQGELQRELEVPAEVKPAEVKPAVAAVADDSEQEHQLQPPRRVPDLLALEADATTAPLEGDEGNMPLPAEETEGLPPGLPHAPPRTRRPPPMRAEDALDAISSLNKEIAALLPEVAWMAPPLVRLQLTAWLASARGLQEAAMHERSVEEAVRQLAGRLGTVTKRWWPGNVSALQLHTTPAGVNQNLALGLAGRLAWDQVAEAIEVRLDGADDGWADDRALEPRPNAVEQTFGRIVSNLVALLGPLDVEPSRLSLGHVEDPATRKMLQEWARRLRWMRGVAPSGEQWAQAMGHLRWVAQQAPATRRYLDAALDPEKAPREGTWAKALGEDPEKRRRQRRVRSVLTATPGPSASAAAVAAWLTEALALGADLTNRQVVGLVPEHRGVIAGLAPEDLGDVGRTVRSRLRKLQKVLQAGESPVPAPAIDDDVDEDNGLGDIADPVGDLVTAVRARVDGKRAVFVSNRADPALKEKLEAKLGLVIEWCEGEPRRMQSMAKQVQAGSYDLVILATGFSGHTADAVLGKAAAGAGVPFVRAYKGRPLATLRALARDLGIRHEGE